MLQGLEAPVRLQRRAGHRVGPMFCHRYCPYPRFIDDRFEHGFVQVPVSLDKIIASIPVFFDQPAGLHRRSDHLLEGVCVFLAIQYRGRCVQVAAQPPPLFEFALPSEVHGQSAHVSHGGHTVSQVHSEVFPIVDMDVHIK